MVWRDQNLTFWAWFKCVLLKNNTAHHPENARARVRYGGGSVTLSGCLSSAGKGASVKVRGNCDQFHTISHFWHETFRLGKLSKEKNLTFHPYKDSTHSSKSTEMCLHNRKIKVFEWPSQIPVMNPAKHLWGWTEGGFTEEAFAVWRILSAFAKTSGQKLPILDVLLQ